MLTDAILNFLSKAKIVVDDVDVVVDVYMTAKCVKRCNSDFFFKQKSVKKKIAIQFVEMQQSRDWPISSMHLFQTCGFLT